MSSDPVELPGLGAVRRVYAKGADAVNSTGCNSVPPGADSRVVPPWVGSTVLLALSVFSVLSDLFGPPPSYNIPMLSLILVMMAGPAEPTVTFAADAIQTKAFVEEIAKQTGQKLSCAPNVGIEPIVVQLDEAPLSELMPKLGPKRRLLPPKAELQLRQVRHAYRFTLLNQDQHRRALDA